MSALHLPYRTVVTRLFVTLYGRIAHALALIAQSGIQYFISVQQLIVIIQKIPQPNV